MPLKFPSVSKQTSAKSQEKFTFSQRNLSKQTDLVRYPKKFCETNYRSELQSLALPSPPQLRILSTASGSHPRAVYQKHLGWSPLSGCTVREIILKDKSCLRIKTSWKNKQGNKSPSVKSTKQSVSSVQHQKLH